MGSRLFVHFILIHTRTFVVLYRRFTFGPQLFSACDTSRAHTPDEDAEAFAERAASPRKRIHDARSTRAHAHARRASRRPARTRMSAGDLAKRLQGVGVNDASLDDDEGGGGAVVVGGKEGSDDGGVRGTPVGEPAAASAKSRAVELIDDDRLLQAARVIRESGVAVEGGQGDEKLLRFMSKATLMEDLLQSLKSAPGQESGWLVQGEHMGKRDVSIYYRTDPETGTKLTARIESPIDKTMLVPFLSVLNESDLYSTW